MRNKKGQFIKGLHYSPGTEFKKGQHWRKEKPYWKKEWLENAYCVLEQSSAEIANQFGVTDANILFWLRKHNIPRRTVSEVRKMKYWGSKGKDNGMYNRRGEDSPNWKGGCTPERQAFYQSEEWKTACSYTWKRDNATCQKCGKSYKEIKLHVHHIISFSVEEKRADTNNLILLCKTCHNWVHSKKNTEGRFLG